MSSARARACSFSQTCSNLSDLAAPGRSPLLALPASRSRALAGYFRSRFACLREADCNRLLTTRDFFSRAARAQRPVFTLVHSLRDLVAGALAVFALPRSVFFSHGRRNAKVVPSIFTGARNTSTFSLASGGAT